MHHSSVLAALVPTGRLGAARGGEQRRGLYPAHADAVRLALRHRVEHHVGLRVTNVVHVERILVVADGLALAGRRTAISQPMRRCGRAASSAEVSSALSMSSVEPSTAAASAAACASASSSTPGAGSISAMIWPPGTSMLPHDGHQRQHAVGRPGCRSGSGRTQGPRRWTRAWRWRTGGPPGRCPPPAPRRSPRPSRASCPCQGR